MFLFIFESIGTSEMMLIGLIALLVFGPRKLPEIARTIGKTMAEFRRSTDEFKQTWEQEIMLEDSKLKPENLSDSKTQIILSEEKTISRSLNADKIELIKPEIKEINKDIFEQKFTTEDVEKIELPENVKKSGDKQNWL